MAANDVLRSLASLASRRMGCRRARRREIFGQFNGCGSLQSYSLS